MSKLWETGKEFKVPESVAYDPAAGVVYVSNYDAYDPSRGEGRQYISKVSLEGEILDLSWATGLENLNFAFSPSPTTMNLSRSVIHICVPNSPNLLNWPTDTNGNPGQLTWQVTTAK